MVQVGIHHPDSLAGLKKNIYKDFIDNK